METRYLYDNASTDKMIELNEKCILKSDGQFKLKIVEDSVILPYREGGTKPYGLGGVVDLNGNFIEESSDKSFGGFYHVNMDNIETSDEEVIFLGYTIAHWGTFLVDFTRRLYYYNLSGRKLKIAYCGVGFERGTFGVLENNCYSFLSLLGIKRTDVLDIRTPIRFKRVYIPEVDFEFEKWIFPEYKIPFQNIRKSLIKNKNYPVTEKVYFTRCRFPLRKESGEKYIEKFFEQNGFLVIAPETIDVIEQIKIMTGCKVVASLEGTIAHNILFALPGTQQVIIRKQSECNPRQTLFNKVTDTRVFYIDCYYEPFRSFPLSHDDGPFLILFNKKMRIYANDHHMKYDIRYIFYNFYAIIVYLWRCFWIFFKTRVKGVLTKTNTGKMIWQRLKELKNKK